MHIAACCLALTGFLFLTWTSYFPCFEAFGVGPGARTLQRVLAWLMGSDYRNYIIWEHFVKSFAIIFPLIVEILETTGQPRYIFQPSSPRMVKMKKIEIHSKMCCWWFVRSNQPNTSVCSDRSFPPLLNRVSHVLFMLFKCFCVNQKQFSTSYVMILPQILNTSNLDLNSKKWWHTIFQSPNNIKILGVTNITIRFFL